jgi:[ribosomal protein S18]-alanine N-acetyltransferase
MHSHFQEASMVSVILGPLAPEMLPAAVNLDQLIFGKFWAIQAYRQELERPSSDLLAIWLLERSELEPQLLGLGCSWLILDEAHILLLAVHPDYRQRSLGKAMLLGLLERACTRGANYATLEVKSTNDPAIALYEKLGFKAKMP